MKVNRTVLLGVMSYMLVIIMFYVPSLSTPTYSVGYAFFSVIYGLHTWIWIVALFGLARKFLSGTNSFIKYFSQASYPFYILHMVLLTIIGYYVVQWHLGVPAEFAVLSVLAFAATLGSYELLVRRTRITRFLFGMKV